MAAAQGKRWAAAKEAFAPATPQVSKPKRRLSRGQGQRFVDAIEKALGAEAGCQRKATAGRTKEGVVEEAAKKAAWLLLGRTTNILA